MEYIHSRELFLKHILSFKIPSKNNLDDLLKAVYSKVLIDYLPGLAYFLILVLHKYHVHGYRPLHSIVHR